MSLDEETNNHQAKKSLAPLNGQNGNHTDTPASSDTFITADGTGATAKVGALSPQLSNDMTPLPSTSREVISPETELYAQKRARLNRLLMRKRRYERTSKNWSMRLLIAAAVLMVLFTIFLSSGAGGAYAYYQSQLPLLNNIATHSLFQTTHIYDRNGKLLYQLYNQQDGYGRRTYVDYNSISPLLVNASIAAEDHTFWTNDGVDIQSFARAAIADIQSHGIVEGGSTITEEVVKNQIFANQDRTFQVKGEEVMLAYGLAQQYPKWKIMEMYLNTIYYGDLNYGVEAAAQDYYNIQPKCSHTACIPAVAQLDLAQASMLAGLPQSPSYYDPIINKPAAMQRQKLVLDQMVQLHMITAQQEQSAITETAKFKFKSYANLQGIQAPHFVRYVIDQVLVPLLGAQNLLNGGYNIYTTLDLNLEKKVEQITYDNLYKPQCTTYLGCSGPLNIEHNVNNAAVVVMSPSNGEILAMDGSADFNNNSPAVRGQFNAAIAPRQTGSAFKPVVYATAFQMGWYPAMVLGNHKTVYPGNGPPYYSPNNYGNVFLNGFPMTIRNATANSINIPAVDTIEYTGIKNVQIMAGRLGLTEVSSQPTSAFGPSMALGTTGISLLHMTSAYATFANQGVRVPPTSILEITNSQGQTLYHYDASHPQGYRAISPQVAFLINSVLSDKVARYYEFSPGNPLELDRPAAAKTGTTDSFRDNWTMGYTPYLAVGVWAGNSDNTPMNNVIGITGAGFIWHDVTEYASQYYNYPASDFVRPPGIQTGTVSALTGLLPNPGEPTVSDWFINGTMPTIQGSYPYIPPRRNGTG
ncbi:MAG TPA: transglycosylase domain-containing protein [Ktedonobacteraceae bacterium]|nr:transglycosylase domain-containing protein [Ktedonobacteraceae bacterium]